MKEYITGIFIALVFAAIVYLPNGMRIFKSFNQPLTLSCHCEEASLCRWYYQDQQSVPDNWVQANGDLNLPANDWTVYGGITSRCGSDSNAYTVMSPGEVCNTCLQLYFTSSVNDIICEGRAANVTISTDRSYSHGDAITLHVNDSVCSSNNHGNGVVRCRERGNVIGHTLSYTITAINAGTVTMRAQTTYYGATWYSMVEMITVVKQCNESSPGDIINTTSVTTTDVTTTPPSSDDVVTTNDSKEMPTNSTDDSSSGGSAVPEQPISKVNISGNMEDDKSASTVAIIIAIVIAIIIFIVTATVIYCCWRKRNNKQNQDQKDQQSVPVTLHKLNTACNNSSQESAQDYCC